jgi:hypothetical protein
MDLELVINPTTELANKTIYWYGNDSEEVYNKNLADPIQYSRLKAGGWINTTIEYQYNSNGFRGSEFDSAHNHFCVFGGSIVNGIGLLYEQLYPTIIANQLNIQCFNFGQPGGSNDTAFRLALTWIPKLKPKFVIYQTTFKSRVEMIELPNHEYQTPVWQKKPPARAEIYGIQTVAPGRTAQINRDHLYKNWVMHDLNQDLLKLKNLLAFRQLCKECNCQLIETADDNFDTDLDHMDRARDLYHPGPNLHRQQAEKMLNIIWQKS